MGTANPSSRPDSSTDASSDSSSPTESSTYEKWLVRILLGLAFGLAFGIEGMTLVRSFLLDPGSDEPVETQEKQPVLRKGDALVPATAPTVRVERLRLFASEEAWTFTLIARPDSTPRRAYTLTFDRLTMTNGSARTTAPSHTWAVGDTVAFAASWPLPPGQRPDALTVTATTEVAPDSTVSATRTVDVGHVPVRMQRE